MKPILFAILALLCVPFGVQANQVSDLHLAQWEESIEYLLDQDIVQGYPDGSFQPQRTINRAEFTKIIIGSLFENEDIQLQDDSCFNDVKTGQWFAPYVCLAQSEGILQGYPDGQFRPAQNINQAEALKILYESFYEGVEETNGAWYQKYLDAAEYDGMLYFAEENPGAHLLTREQMAYFTAWMLDENGVLTEEISLENFYGDEYETVDFGWEEMTADDCYEDEYYDDADQRCYLLDNGNDFTEDAPIFSEQTLQDHPQYHDHSPLDAGLDSVTYEITGESIKSNRDITSAIQDRNMKVWERFKALIPASYRANFAEFIVYNDPEDDTAAYVEEINSDLLSWRIAVNTDQTFDSNGNFSDRSELDLTLIHEFAHVMTLSNAQVDPEKSETTCRLQFFTGEGCARKNSFINLFFKKFWNQDLLTQAEFDPESLYQDHPDHFVTDYAATNPGEDIAETFAYFVARSKPKECNANISNKKLCFFYQFPSLVTLRKAIRTAIE